MTDEGMAPLEPVEKGADAHLVRELLAFATERLMAAEVDQLTGAACGARTPDRINHRNGCRERGWETRVGRIELAIPKLRKGLHFPALLEPRRTAEKAPTAVVHRAQRARSIPAGTMARRPSRGSLRPRHLDPIGRRPGQGDGRHGRLEEPGLALARGHRRARPGFPRPADRGRLAVLADRCHLPEIAAGRSDRPPRRHSRHRRQHRRPARGPGRPDRRLGSPRSSGP